MSTAYPLGRLQFYMGYFNVFRQKLWQELLFELSPKAKLAASVDFPLRVYRTEINGGEFIGLLNPTLDALAKPTLRLTNFDKSSGIKILSNDGQRQSGKVEINRIGESVELIVDSEIEPLKAIYITSRCEANADFVS